MKTKASIDSATLVFILTLWIAGVVLAKGFWLTTLAITLPFYAWYLVIEKIMLLIGAV